MMVQGRQVMVLTGRGFWFWLKSWGEDSGGFLYFCAGLGCWIKDHVLIWLIRARGHRA